MNQLEPLKRDKHNSQPEYMAFISYRHADNTEEDRQWATWLHQQLEVYDVPADLIGTKNLQGKIIADRIYPVFRDEVSLPADSDLSSAITDALDRSQFLIVLCSPRAVQSHYVNEEILHFKRSGKKDRIMAALILGEPNASIDESKLEDPEHANTLECFPKALQYHLTSQGELDTTQQTEPIAANFRLPDGGKGLTNPSVYKQKLLAQGRKKPEAERLANSYELQLNNAKLKIIAGIIGVPLDQLTQRDKVHQLNKTRIANKRFIKITAAMTILAISALIAGGAAYQHWQRAEQQKNRAEALLSQVRGNLSFMNFELHTVLDKYVPQHARVSVLKRIDDMVEALQQQSEQTAEGKRLIAFATQHKADLMLKNNQLDPTKALALYQKAHHQFQQISNHYQRNLQFQHDLSISNTKLGDIQLLLGDTDSALEHYQTALKIDHSQVKKDPKNILFQDDLSVSNEKLGEILFLLGETDNALTYFQAALKIRQALVKKASKNTKFQHGLSITNERIGDILLRQGNIKNALTHYQATLKVRQTLVEKDPKNTQFEYDLSITNERIGDILLRQGNIKNALTHYQAILKVRQILVKKDPENTEFQGGLLTTRDRLGNILLRQGDTDNALTHYQAALWLRQTLVEKDPENTDLQSGLSISNNSLGNTLLRQGHATRALTHYEAAFRINQKLVNLNPKKTQFQLGLSMSNQKLGDIHLQLGDIDRALTYYQGVLNARLILVEKDSENTEFQLYLSISYYKLGTIYQIRKNKDQTLKYMTLALNKLIWMQNKGILAKINVQLITLLQQEIDGIK